jgi:soluble P-type ATPase
MAKTPRKSQDPTEAALSAIEEALQIGADESAELPFAIPAQESVAPGARPAEQSDRQHPSPRTQPPRRTDRMSFAANDDRQTVGQILAALHTTPSPIPLYIAAGAAIWWAVMALFIGYSRAREDIAATAGWFEVFDLPYFWSFLATMLLPPVAFVLFAFFLRRGQELRNISRAMTEVTVRLAEPEGVSSDAIVSVGQAIRREVAALGDGIERAVARSAELESLVHGEVASLERAYEENETRMRSLVEELQRERDSIVSHGTRLKEAFAGSHEAFNLDIEGLGNRINAVVEEASARVTERISTQAEAASAQITAAGDILLDTFTTKSNEVSDQLNQSGVDIAAAIGDRNGAVRESFQELAATLIASIVERGDAVRDDIIGRLRASEDAIAQRGNEIADRVSADSTELASRITDGFRGFDDTVKVYGSGLLDRLTQTVSSLNEQTRLSLNSFDDRVAAKLEDITQTVNTLNEQTRASLGSFDEQVASKIEETSTAIDSRIDRIEKTLDTRTQSLNEALANRTLEIARTIADGARQANEAVDTAVAGAGEYFSGRAQEIARTLTERTEAIDQTLGRRALELTDNLDDRIGRFEHQVADRLDRITVTIEEKGIAVTDALSGRIENVTSGLRASAEELEHSLTTKVQGVTETMRGDAAQVEKTLTDLAEQVSKTLVERTREVTSSHEMLRDDVTGVLERLRDAGQLLKQLLEDATGNLVPLEATIAERVSSLQEVLETTLNATRGSVDHVDSQLRDLREVSGGVVRDLSVLTQRFEDQSRFLSGAADSLQETHRRIDMTLSDRREAIERFSSVLANRASDLDERLARFNRLMQDSLGAAEERAHEIARLVAESTTRATQAITQQYDTIRSTSEEERERTAGALKVTYDQTAEEMKTLFSDATQRFAETARELRQVAEEVHSTLDHTRQELKRGVLELPQETLESTSAMRRVVADQIKALAELNDIVARHARGIDVMEPRQFGRQEETAAVGAGGGTRYAAPQRRDADAVVDMPAARTARGTGQTGPRPERRDGAPAQRAQAREGGDPRRAPREPGGERGAAWLTGLLSNPSEESESEGPLGQAIESLDSLSADIARIVDHDAAVAMWDSQRRGERNAPTRRLYTAQGQKTFEEIRRRYRRSPEFRQTVDRYIDEFERLLEQVARDDRSQVLSKTYLTSDTGKVYTLLAHAAGKLNG